MEAFNSGVGKSSPFIHYPPASEPSHCSSAAERGDTSNHTEETRCRAALRTACQTHWPIASAECRTRQDEPENEHHPAHRRKAAAGCCFHGRRWTNTRRTRTTRPPPLRQR